MSQFLQLKRKLISEVFEKAKKNTIETSFSGVLKDLELALREDFNIQLSYKSFETYYKFLVEKNEDYNIKPIILNDLSRYLGHEDFKNFCEKNSILGQTSSIKVTIDGKEESSTSKNFSEIFINITNSPIFTLPEFVSKNRNSFGIAGLLLVSGFFANKTDFFQKTQANESPKIIKTTQIEPLKEENNPQKIVNLYQSNGETKSEQKNIKEEDEDCMYWNENQYIKVFCDENMGNYHVEQFNLEKYKLKKITQPDTLNIENAVGKVWYDKSDNKIEFFTNHGIHPENKKTLKEVTVYILEKYCSK